MSDKNNNSVKSGIGFSGLLTIAFVVLKLCGIITWSWLWVLSPLWISAAIVLLVVIIILIIVAVNSEST